MSVGDEALALFGGPKVCVCQAERSYAGSAQCFDFTGASTDRVVFHEDDPVILARDGEPFFVCDGLRSGLAVHRCQRVDHETAVGERCRQVVAAETSIDEELRRRERRASRHG